jgi:acyl-coenzyme A thioesterase PaaI-like protein
MNSTSDSLPAKATASEIGSFLLREFPQTKCTVVTVGRLTATVRHAIGVGELRPGGTVSGPVLMTVADVALYVAILGEIGLVPLAVTTNLSINFLRRPAADAAVVGVCRLMKVGKALIVGEVELYSEGDAEPVAHAVGTYSVPPSRRVSVAATPGS